MKDFIKTTIATMFGVSILCVLGGFLFLLILGAVLSGGDEEVEVQEASILLVDLNQPIADGPVEVAPMDQLSPMGGASVHPLRLWTLTEAIRQAADDSRIEGLLLRGPVVRGGLHSGYPALREIRAAIEDFAESGKPTFAIGSYYDEATYYVASAADTIWVDPSGGVLLNGFASERMYYASAMEKLGVEVQVTRVGRYKSAVEPYLLKERSEADIEQTRKYLGSMEEAFLSDIAKSRGLDTSALQGLAAIGDLLTPEAAEDAGLVDGAMDINDIVAALEDQTNTELETIGLNDYSQTLSDDADGDSIAVVYAEGEIHDGEGDKGIFGDTLARTLRELRDDEEVAAVVLRVNSPGGSAQGSEVILREMTALKAEKPVVVSMGSYAASGGYWIACRADEIVAQPNTLTGSIGVFGMLPNASQLMEKLGVNVSVVKTAEHADFDSLFRSKTETELGMIQVIVDRIYDDFLDRVSEGRSLPRERVAEIAQGRVWTGADALELGLVDSLGGLEDAIARAADRAGLTEHQLYFPQVTEPEWTDLLLQELMGAPGDTPLASTGALGREVQAVLEEVRRFEQLGELGAVQARLPYDLRIR